jgi:hypothetical protein
VVVAVCALAGCGATSISTDAASKALQDAGFRQLIVDNEQPDAPDSNKIGNYSVIDTSERPWPPTVELIRYRSSHVARKVYAGFSRSYFRSLVAYWRHPPKLCKWCADGTMRLPPGFEMRKLQTYRICNVILWSYNARLDNGLTARAHRAAARLRASCH